MNTISKTIERETCIKLYALLIQAKRSADILGTVNKDSKNYLNYRSNIAQMIDSIQDDFMHCDLSEADLLAMAKESTTNLIKNKISKTSDTSDDEAEAEAEDDDDDDDYPFE